MSNSDIVTPVRQNYKRSEFHHYDNSERKGKAALLPCMPKGEHLLSGSLGKGGACPPPMYYGSIEEHKDGQCDNPSATTAAEDDRLAGAAGDETVYNDCLEGKRVAGQVDWPEEDDVFPSSNQSKDHGGRHRSVSEDSQETLSYTQLSTIIESRKKQARELRKGGSAYVKENERAKFPGLPFIAGIPMETFTNFAGDFDCSIFTSGKHADDASDDGSGMALSTFDEEDESFVSYDDEGTYRDEDTYRTNRSTRTREAAGNDGIDQALRWADENFLCN